MDETGWGHDLGLPKKPLVLSPYEEETNVYYRACVVEVNRKCKTVRLLLAASDLREATAAQHACATASTAAQ
jgi:hypothetical protein